VADISGRYYPLLLGSMADIYLLLLGSMADIYLLPLNLEADIIPCLSIQ
jgi:hypothetical protein